MSLPIDYLSDCAAYYTCGLIAARSLDDLRTHIEIYRRVADDAWQVALAMDGEAFQEFEAGSRLERNGKFAGKEFWERFGAILMPELLMQVSIVASRFQVPWGLAFIRCKEAGHIVENDGIATWPRNELRELREKLKACEARITRATELLQGHVNICRYCDGTGGWPRIELEEGPGLPRTCPECGPSRLWLREASP